MARMRENCRAAASIGARSAATENVTGGAGVSNCKVRWAKRSRSERGPLISRRLTWPSATSVTGAGKRASQSERDRIGGVSSELHLPILAR